LSTIVSFARAASSPWKNGLGTTTELAVFPPGARGDDFEWRVSIARLDTSAPFSIYPGIERCLAVLRGEMVMVRQSQPPQRLTPHSPPVRFGGDEIVDGQVASGPVLDLNVMCKASHWRATLRRMRWSTQSRVSIAAPAVLCSISDPMDIEIDGNASRLNLYDAVVVPIAATLTVNVSQPVDAYLVEFQRQP
jgi:environmental stress-induced protein Ves